MPDCPMCAEPIEADAEKCPSCGEGLGPRSALPPPQMGRLPIFAAVVLCGVSFCLVGSIVAAVAIPSLIQPRQRGNEAAAIGALKTIAAAQTLFREGDKEGDGTLDYGSLTELSDVTYIDALLGSGQKQGYVFQAAASPTTPEFMWMAVANPAVPGTTGDRYFVTNQAGVVYYSPTTAFVITPDCAIPAHAVPVGK